MRFKNIREFFWPLIRPTRPTQPPENNQVKRKDISVQEEDLDIAYDLALKFSEGEKERKQRVESKSRIFIGITSIIIAIVLNLIKELILNRNKQIDLTTLLILAFLFLLVIYFGRTVWFAIKALERQHYHILKYKDIIKGDKEYRKNLILIIINNTIKNFKPINHKVESMVMAQAYFKRGIVIAIICPLFFFLYFFITKKFFTFF